MSHKLDRQSAKIIRIIDNTIKQYRGIASKSTVQDVILFVKAQLDGQKLAIDDSLLLRLRFIAGQTGCKLDLSRIQHNKNLLSTDPLLSDQLRINGPVHAAPVNQQGHSPRIKRK